MKTKPTRHKESNTFKFIPFSERIAGLNVDVFHRVSSIRDDTEEEGGTHLQRSIEKWTVQNGTIGLEQCLRELPPCLSLAQLIHQKDKAVKTLLSHIDLRDPLTLQALLELVVALARDLRHEFYPYFSQSLESLFGVISTSRDPDVLEWSFQCMAYLLKFLWRSLLREPASLVYESVLPLLQDAKPSYIQEFAAQCFAFVARKVRDKPGFVAAILRKLEETQDGIAGTGRLICETVSGVSGTLHSGSEPLLRLLLTSLADPELPGDLLRDVLSHTITALATKLKAPNWAPFWTIATETLQEFSGSSKFEGASRLLVLMRQACEARGGSLVTEPSLVTRALTPLLLLPQQELEDGTEDNREKSAVEAVSLAACLLNAPALKLPQELTAALASQVLSTQNPKLLFNFVSQVLTCPGFEVHILPKFLKFCQSSVTEATLTDHSRSLVKLLSQLVLEKSPLCHSGLELPAWKQYPLDLNNSPLSSLILSQLDSTENYEELISSIIILPHLKKLDSIIVKNKLNNLLKLLQEENENDAEIQSNLFAFSLVVESIVHMKLVSEFDSDIFLSWLLKHSSELSALRMFDLFMTASGIGKKEEENKSILFNQLMTANLHHNLSSPHHKIRVLTCHILSLVEPGSLLRQCLATENTPATIEEYRDRLQRLNALEPAKLSKEFETDVTLRFLVGQLYVNFRLLWEPVCAMIATHAHAQPPAQFWPVLAEQLGLAAERASSGASKGDVVTPIGSLSSSLLVELHASLESQLDVADHTNFRCLLWHAMTLFPELCEAKNRDLSALFLDFLKNEFYNSEVSDSNFWDVTRKTSAEDSKMEVESEKLEQEIEEEDDDEEENEKHSSKKSKPRTASKSLQAHLELLSKLRNPRGMHREAELCSAYHELLRHRNSAIQKLALDCIMQYKHDYLIPYKDQLYGLLEDKGFKSQLVMFNIETDSEFIQPNHREKLIPVLLRILYSKMQARSKHAGTSRRSLILRFLSGCKQEEMLLFLNLAFKPTLEHCQDENENIIDMVHRIIQSVDLHKIIPPKRLTSTVTLANVVLAHLSRNENGMSKCTSLLLKILLVVASQITGILARREEITKSAILALRNSRKFVIDGISRIFARGNSGDASTVYQWNSDEFDAIFDAIVWPSIDFLTHESAMSPTALLRLFVTWSENPCYFSLLVKHQEERPECNPLAGAITLLNGEATRPPVTAAILELCLRLLTLKPDEPEEGDDEPMEEEEVVEELKISNVLPVDQEAVDKLKLSEPLNYGSQLLLPHVPALLQYLQRRATLASAKKKAKGGLSPRDLSVLSRVSELVTEPEPSLALLKLIIPLCVRKAQRGSGDNTLTPLLSTTLNLLRCIENPEQFTLQIAPLFSAANGRQSRQIICSILFIILHKNDAKIISDLNSWDKKRIDEPDFDRRINSFSKVTKMDDINLELGIIVIHNCYYSIKAEKDISLRDCASHCLQTLCPKLAEKYASVPESKTLVLERTVMDILRRGVRDKNENVQHEMLGLLGVMVRRCAELHPTLRDLQGLACADDPELDFFENMRHLQVHRRSRALLRFCQLMEVPGATMKTLTLTQIILPLASAFLCAEKYAKINSLVDSAIQTVGTVCSLLPWPQYEAILKFQLGRLPRLLDYQKQLVRTVIAILDAFHYDLSAAPAKPGKPNKSGKGKKQEPELVVPEEILKPEAQPEEISPEKETTETATKTDDENIEIEDPEEKVEDDSEVLASILESTEIEEVQVPKNIPLSPIMAIKVKHSILYQLLPKLHQVISARLATDMTHKVNKNSSDPADDREKEAQEVLRVPIAIAIVKLLQKLPPGILQQSLTGVILKVCVFLKSRLESTRRAARDTLQQILRSLGPKYLPKVLSELTSLLTRGYLVHVLVFTVHSLIVGMADLLQPGDIDPCLQNVLSVCHTDMFGEAAEEKEVAQIAGKVTEARSHKSYDTLHLLAKFVSEKCLTDLLLPLKDVLASTHSYKLVRRATACLDQVVRGLAENTFVSAESLLTFAYGAASQSVQALLGEHAKDKGEIKMSAAKKAIQRVDTFLIQAAPKRCGPVVKKSADTHAHLFVGFGLQLLHFLLKKDRTSDIPDAMLDPFVSILAPSLQSQHSKVTTLALQCLSSMFKSDLPSLRTKVVPITEDIFKLLHKYAGSVQGKGENFDMANAAFKVVGELVRHVEYHTLTSQQLRLLLLYAERDVQADSARQATAFTLLKAVLKRRMTSPELSQVMTTIAELSITSEMTHVRTQARQVYLFYLLEYPLGKQIENQLTFLVSQLSFELQPGRISTLETLQGLITAMPVANLANHAGLLFVAVAARLINDDSPECRKVAANLIKSLLHKMGHNGQEELFGATLLWFRDKKLAHRRLAAQLCGLFVSVECARFESRLPTVLPLIASGLNPDPRPGRFVRAPKSDQDDETQLSSDGGSLQDHFLFQLLQLLIKISTQTPTWLQNMKYREHAMEISSQVQTLLSHPHEWVRLGASQFLGCIFASINPEYISNAIVNNESSGENCILLFEDNTSYKVKSLTLDLCDQLQPLDLKEEFAEQIVKNLVYLARVLRHIPSDAKPKSEDEEGGVSLLWLARKLRKSVNIEIAQTPGRIVVRCAVLRWVAGVALDLGGEGLLACPPLLHHMLAPVARETALASDNTPALRRLAKEVAALVKEQIGVESFARAISKLQGKMGERRAARKRQHAQEAMTDPARSAQRKIKKQQVKKVAKKRKISEFKGRTRKNFRDKEENLDF